MQHRTYFRAIYLVSFLIFAVACGENGPDISLQPQTQSTIVESAKNYFLEKTQTSNLRTAGENKKKLNPQWEKAQEAILENGDNVLIIPVPEYKIEAKEFSFYRSYVFKQLNGRIVDGRIVEFIGDLTSLKGDKNSLLKKYRNSQIKNYNGAIISYDLNYQYLAGYSYSKGQRNRAGTHIWGKGVFKGPTHPILPMWLPYIPYQILFK